MSRRLRLVAEVGVDAVRQVARRPRAAAAPGGEAGARVVGQHRAAVTNGESKHELERLERFGAIVRRQLVAHRLPRRCPRPPASCARLTSTMLVATVVKRSWLSRIVKLVTSLPK